ncbi:MAG TPA: NUDIX hydrolase [Dehalococcoidia bacterium]|jgi:8-oxo-dGTP diphosphatase|nr:NUDIX hydrolase [Dehalococcoidia bacterium]|tara:strand:- start:30 stop:518 length:489 start_codon:yes stop_codon:yes gene_type:complete
MPVPEKYNSKYNLGVGGAVVHEGKLLMVKRASRRGRGNWQIPGGFVEPDETIELAVTREVFEESGVESKVKSILGIRNRYDDNSDNSTYVVFLLEYVGGTPTADTTETSEAKFFTLDEIKSLEQVPPINLKVAEHALNTNPDTLKPEQVTGPNGNLYTLFIG